MQFKQLQINPKQNFGTSKEFEPMASALVPKCITIWAMKARALGAGQFVEFILTRERNNEAMKMNELRKYKFLNEDMIVAVVIAI